MYLAKRKSFYQQQFFHSSIVVLFYPAIRHSLVLHICGGFYQGGQASDSFIKYSG